MTVPDASVVESVDTRALASDDADAIVQRLVSLRREIATLRRALNPQREVFAALVRPDLALQSDAGTPWAAVADRFHTAIESVDNARELLVGTFDIVMAHTGQRTNDVMRVRALAVVGACPTPAGPPAVERLSTSAPSADAATDDFRCVGVATSVTDSRRNPGSPRSNSTSGARCLVGSFPTSTIEP